MPNNISRNAAYAVPMAVSSPAAPDRRAAGARSILRYKCDDAVKGWTVWNAARRAEYRLAVRHSRRVAKNALRVALAMGVDI